MTLTSKIQGHSFKSHLQASSTIDKIRYSLVRDGVAGKIICGMLRIDTSGSTASEMYNNCITLIKNISAKSGLLVYKT